MNNSVDFTPDTSLFKKDWLPLEQAIQMVIKFEQDFGAAHLVLACHAALASVLTPELVNLIRINFLEKRVDWIAECDLLLSDLCQPIRRGIFEIEPQIRQVLLVELQTQAEYGPRRLEEIAYFLYKYSETAFVNKLPMHIKRTYQWISGAYIDPDTTIQNMFDVLKDTDEFVARMPDYLHIGKTLALIANPLEMGNLQVELDDLVNTAQLSLLYWTGDKEKLLSKLQNTRPDLNAVTHALTKPLVNWLATSELVTPDERETPSTQPLESVIEPPPTTDKKPVSIYCSYVPEDEETQTLLEHYLDTLKTQGMITYLNDRLPSYTHSEDRSRAIAEYLDTAQIILLLISADFMASVYPYIIEMQRAMERLARGDARIIPILARPTYWKDSPFAHLQVLPRNTIPIKSWDDQQLAFEEVVAGIQRVIEDIQNPQISPERAREKETHAKPIEVFVAYAHKDEPFLNSLEEHLQLLVQQGFISIWSDHEILPGRDWEHEINTHLERASLILLLVSADFLVSGVCSEITQKALQRHQTHNARVFPILVRPCLWENTPFAALLYNGRPITLWEDRDAAFDTVVDSIQNIIQEPDFLQSSPTLPEKDAEQKNTQPIEMFVSYASEDEAYLLDLDNYLYPLQQQRLITIWSDRHVDAGTYLREEREIHLQRATLILLLVSAHFLASDYCNYEMQKALERYQANEARVIPIIVRPCLWKEAPFAHILALPNRAIPITNWNNQDEAFADVANGILTVVEKPDLLLSLSAIKEDITVRPGTQPIEVFVSYAHEDEEFRIELEKHLAILSRQNLITIWSDRQVPPGSDWAQTLALYLERATIILLLVSPDFLASNYTSLELQRALQRDQEHEAHVIPIIVKPCNWSNAPFARLRVSPTDGRPITTWSNPDDALVDIVHRIKGVIDDLPSREEPIFSPTLPTIWNIPYSRNLFFTGRDDVLDQLHDVLQTNAPRNLTGLGGIGKTQVATKTLRTFPVALTGLGGIGKTQVAIEYAYRYHLEYQIVLWVQAGSQETLTSSYAQIATLLALPEQNVQDLSTIAREVRHWLQTHTGWLLIFDGVDNLDMVKDFFPRMGSGHILLTTRTQVLEGRANKIEIETYSAHIGAIFLLRRARLLAEDASLEQASETDRALAIQLTEMVGGLPLALDQAGAYIEETRTSLARYLQIYQTHRSELLRRTDRFNPFYPDSVATTWLLSFEKVGQRDPAAVDLLRVCAFLAPDSIPEEIIIKGATHLGPSLAPIANDKLRFDEAIEVLRTYSLLRRNTDATLSIHRLVQAVLQDNMSAEERKLWAERTVRAVNTAFPEVEFAQWATCELYLPHALVCANWIEQEQMVFEDAVYLLRKIGYYLEDRALYAQAEPLFLQALAIQEYIKEDGVGMATSLSYLAGLYENQGRYAKAEPLYRRALLIYEEQLGPNHLYTATSLNNLAGLYESQGRYAEAEPLYQRALLTREEQLGSGHSDTATSLNDLAGLYESQGRYAEAEPLYQRALLTREEQLGPNHPYTATSLHNLAFLYENQSRYAEAEPLYQRALLISEEQLGPNHPDTAASLNNLGRLYLAQGKYVEAEPLLTRALEIRETQLGPTHPDTAISLNDLAELYQSQGKYIQAKQRYERALTIYEKSLGPMHPRVAHTLDGLATLYSAQRNFAQAEPLYQRALKIYEQALGEEHPDTIRVLEHYARFLNDSKRTKKAREMELRIEMLKHQKSEHQEN